MQDKLQQIKRQAQKEFSSAVNSEELESLRVKYLGRKGEITLILRKLKDLSKEKRPEIGKLANRVKKEIEREIEKTKLKIQKEKIEDIAKTEWIDVTQPGIKLKEGHLHLATQTLDEVIDIFIKMGFDVLDTPEVETTYYNFDFLNTDETHPSRSFQDTFYISPEVLLRTHASTMQGRVMKREKPPIKVISVGKTYRRDWDISHTPMFHQVDGLVISKNVTFGDLKGTLEFFAKEYFGKDRKVRFYGHYFPFTEPSIEMAIDCGICKGKGCRSCGFSGWLELLGAGVVHPQVIKNGGLHPKIYQGVAFGGITPERLAMLKYGVLDARMLYENDLRFLKQF
jgi:phenylalanyl-tRNA synthetase alpha chain